MHTPKIQKKKPQLGNLGHRGGCKILLGQWRKVIYARADTCPCWLKSWGSEFMVDLENSPGQHEEKSFKCSEDTLLWTVSQLNETWRWRHTPEQGGPRPLTEGPGVAMTTPSPARSRSVTGSSWKSVKTCFISPREAFCVARLTRLQPVKRCRYFSVFFYSSESCLCKTNKQNV